VETITRTWLKFFLIGAVIPIAFACGSNDNKTAGGGLTASGEGPTTSSSGTTSSGSGGTAGGGTAEGGSGGGETGGGGTGGGGTGGGPSCPTFEQDIFPILEQAGCSKSKSDTGHPLGCHQSGNDPQLAPLLDKGAPASDWYKAIMTVKLEHPDPNIGGEDSYVVTNNAAGSHLPCSIYVSTGAHPFPPDCGRMMPETEAGEPLMKLNYEWSAGPSDIQMIADWINCGAKEK